MTKIGQKSQNSKISNETFWVIFKQCAFFTISPFNYYYSCNLILLTFSWPMTRSLEHLLETARSRQQQQNSRSGLQKLRTFDHGTKQRRNCLHGWAVMSTYACAINFEGLDLAAAMTTKTKDEKGNTFRTSSVYRTPTWSYFSNNSIPAKQIDDYFKIQILALYLKKYWTKSFEKGVPVTTTCSSTYFRSECTLSYNIGYLTYVFILTKKSLKLFKI